MMRCDVCGLQSSFSFGNLYEMHYLCFGHYLEYLFETSQEEIEIPDERLEVLYPETERDVYNYFMRVAYWRNK